MKFVSVRVGWRRVRLGGFCSVPSRSVGVASGRVGSVVASGWVGSVVASGWVGSVHFHPGRLRLPKRNIRHIYDLSIFIKGSQLLFMFSKIRLPSTSTYDLFVNNIYIYMQLPVTRYYFMHLFTDFP